MVFYRAYRPQTIEELDSEEIREKLSSLLSSSLVPHAFLFTGPKGLGKTSAARIVAKSINCTKRKKGSAKPCNTCDQCISITKGTNLDVLEIDAASNRGIDEIRDLREKIRLAPAFAEKKVYIIDEVHMLTTEAFNALLKTLEEPPAHAFFVLCTTEPQKVPPTIISRCVHIAFRKATEGELLRSFHRIVKQEKIDIDKDVLLILTTRSDGSFRDGVKILEELVMLAGEGKKITKEFFEKKYHTSNISSMVSNLLESLRKKDIREGLGAVTEVTEQGIDMKYFIELLIETLHTMLLASIAKKGDPTSLSLTQIKELVELLTKAHSQLRFAVLSQLPLELAVIEWGETQDNGHLPHVVGDARQPQAARGPATPSVPATARASLNLPSQGSDALRGVGSPSSRVTHSESKDKNTDFLQKLIDKVKTKNHSIAGVLRGCRVKEYDGKKLLLETGFEFHKDRLSQAKTKELLEELSLQICGQKVTVSVQLKGGDTR